MIKLNAKQLRESNPTKEEIKSIKRNPIYFVLDQILDTYNIGSIFRLADAIAVEKVYLCGRMQTPPYHRISKASVGTDKWVPWEHMASTVDAINQLKEQGVQIVSVEQSDKSIVYTDFKPQFPVALVLGNESSGVSQQVVEMSDVSIELPMHGVNISFNVWGTACVAAYYLVQNLPTR